MPSNAQAEFCGTAHVMSVGQYLKLLLPCEAGPRLQQGGCPGTGRCCVAALANPEGTDPILPTTASLLTQVYSIHHVRRSLY